GGVEGRDVIAGDQAVGGRVLTEGEQGRITKVGHRGRLTALLASSPQGSSLPPRRRSARGRVVRGHRRRPRSPQADALAGARRGHVEASPWNDARSTSAVGSEQDVGADRAVGIAEADRQTHAVAELEARATGEDGDEGMEGASVVPARVAHRGARLTEDADDLREVE